MSTASTYKRYYVFTVGWIMIIVILVYLMYDSQIHGFKTRNMVYLQNEEKEQVGEFNCETNHVDADRKTSNFRIANRVVTDYNFDLAKWLQSVVIKKLSASDPEVIGLIRQMLDSPSTHMQKVSRKIVHTPQSSYVMTSIFPEKKEGFFIEAGALDGERSSNTIWMESYMNWTGLLIEPDPYFYTQLLGKNRKSWSINACISPTDHVELLNLEEHHFGSGKMAMGKTKKKWKTQVPCFPLESLLLSLNRTSVDFFSLDVEGLETSILKAINHTRLNIKSWTIEYDKVGVQQLQDVMKNAGYIFNKKIDFVKRDIHMYTRDLVFVK